MQFAIRTDPKNTKEKKLVVGVAELAVSDGSDPKPPASVGVLSVGVVSVGIVSGGVGVVMVGVAGGIGVGFVGGLIGVVVLRLHKQVR